MVTIEDTHPETAYVTGKYDDKSKCTVAAQFDTGSYMHRFYVHHKHLPDVFHPKASDKVWEELESLIATVVDAHLTAKFGE
jgi:hypothetical protein